MPHVQVLARRSLLLRAAGTGAALAVGGMLAACGGSGASPTATSEAAAVTTTLAAVPTIDLTGPTQRLNFALNLEYAGAQFHSYASGGGALPASITGGVGTAGSVTGATAATLSDPATVAAAAALAADKRALVGTLRAGLGAAAAAMPAIDLSTGGAFAAAWRLAGLDPALGLNPYADDRQYLLGALLLQYGRAAAYRVLLDASAGGSDSDALADALAGATWHGALVSTTLAGLAVADGAVATQAAALATALAGVDSSAGGTAALADTLADCCNIPDGSGGWLAFARTPAQLARAAFLGGQSPAGGFFPGGLNLGG